MSVTDPPAPAPDAGNAALTFEAAAKNNPFKAIVMLLEKIKTSLEGIQTTGQAPRWVRIARIRGFQGDKDYIAKAVIPAVDKGLIFMVLYLSHLTLKAKDLLFQTDAAVALMEVSGEMLKTIASDEFAEAVASIVKTEPQDSTAKNPLIGIVPTLETAEKIVGKVPDPKDLDAIGTALFSLLCVEQLSLEDNDLGEKTESHLDIEKCGKVRLLQMALCKPMKIRGLVKAKGKSEDENKDTVDITFLGGRIVRQSLKDKLPEKAVGEWSNSQDTPDTIYSFVFTENKDIEEANRLLEAMGYEEPQITDKSALVPAFAQRLRRFQAINGLQVTGELDNHTINRLMHLDCKTQTLARAKPYDPALLPQDFDASKNPEPPEP